MKTKIKNFILKAIGRGIATQEEIEETGRRVAQMAYDCDMEKIPAKEREKINDVLDAFLVEPSQLGESPRIKRETLRALISGITEMFSSYTDRGLC